MAQERSPQQVAAEAIEVFRSSHHYFRLKNIMSGNAAQTHKLLESELMNPRVVHTVGSYLQAMSAFYPGVNVAKFQVDMRTGSRSLLKPKISRVSFNNVKAEDIREMFDGYELYSSSQHILGAHGQYPGNLLLVTPNHIEFHSRW